MPLNGEGFVSSDLVSSDNSSQLVRAYTIALSQYEPYRGVRALDNNVLPQILTGAIQLGFASVSSLAERHKEPESVIEAWIEGSAVPDTKTRKQIKKSLVAGLHQS